MFEFRISLNDDDYIQFNQYHMMNSPAGKRNLLYYRIIIPLICFSFASILYISDFDDQLIFVETILMAIISILWVIYGKRMILKNMDKSIRRMKKSGRLPYSSEAVLKFDDTSIHEIASDTENSTKYSLIEKISVTEKAIYIYFSSAQAYIIPMAAFHDETEKSRFLEFINLKADKPRDLK